VQIRVIHGARFGRFFRSFFLSALVSSLLGLPLGFIWRTQLSSGKPAPHTISPQPNPPHAGASSGNYNVRPDRPSDYTVNDLRARRRPVEDDKFLLDSHRTTTIGPSESPSEFLAYQKHNLLIEHWLAFVGIGVVLTLLLLLRWLRLHQQNAPEQVSGRGIRINVPSEGERPAAMRKARGADEPDLNWLPLLGLFIAVLALVLATPVLIISLQIGPRGYKKAIQSFALFVCLAGAIIYYLRYPHRLPTIADKVAFFSGVTLSPPTALELVLKD
jgi:hypothetical protein